MSSIFVKAEPYLFLAPSLAILFVFLIFPLLWNTYISLHDVSLVTILNPWKYIGGTNFLDIFSDPNFYMSLRITLMFVGGSVALQFGIGLLMSVLLQYQVKASGILLAINPTIYEAAAIDGATRIRSFRHITLPLLRPFIVINLVLITMWSVNFFDIQLIMTGGGPLFASTTASLYMYRQAFEFGLLSKGAATGIVLIVINLSVAFLYLKFLRR